MLELTMLPARQGDALWIRWGDTHGRYQLLVDMGTEDSGEAVRKRLEALDESQREFELLVVTHVDGDHIGGVLSCLAEADLIPGLAFKDVWFNGWVHLEGGQTNASSGGREPSAGLESFGPAQGERFTKWLIRQPWNRAFDGKQVARQPNSSPIKVTLADGLALTVLGPTPDRLRALIPKWRDEVEAALEKGKLRDVSPGLEPLGSKRPPDLEFPDDLQALAESYGGRDASESNGSSISLLLEYKGRRIILAGDAFADDVAAGLAKVAQPGLEVDAFKLPHHGSKNNVTKALIEAVSCPRWLFSTDGTQFSHPDAAAVARTIYYSTFRTPTLFFNVCSTFNQWWSNPNWKAMYDYETKYGNMTDGVTIVFPTGDG